MIFFLHNVDISEDNNLQLQRKEYFFENIYIIRNKVIHSQKNELYLECLNTLIFIEINF